LGVYTNPHPHVPPFLLILNQSPKEIADTKSCQDISLFKKDYLVKICKVMPNTKTKGDGIDEERKEDGIEGERVWK